MFFFFPWCTMIWMCTISPLVYLTSSLFQCSCPSGRNFTHPLPNTAVMCMCEQCANCNVPFWDATTASLVSCSLVCVQRKRLCSLFLSRATPAHLYFTPYAFMCKSVCVCVCVCVSVCVCVCVQVCVCVCDHKYCTSVLDFLLAVAEEVFYQVYVPVSLSMCQSVQLLSR